MHYTGKCTLDREEKDFEIQQNGIQRNKSAGGEKWQR